MSQLWPKCPLCGEELHAQSLFEKYCPSVANVDQAAINATFFKPPSHYRNDGITRRIFYRDYCVLNDDHGNDMLWVYDHEWKKIASMPRDLFMDWSDPDRNIERMKNLNAFT